MFGYLNGGKNYNGFVDLLKGQLIIGMRHDENK